MVSEEVYRFRILGEWSNPIGYKMGFVSGHDLHYGQNVFGVDLQAWMEKWRGRWHDNTFCKGGFPEVNFLDNLKPLDKKLGLYRTPTLRPFHFIVFSILFTLPTITSNTLVLC